MTRLDMAEQHGRLLLHHRDHGPECLACEIDYLLIVARTAERLIAEANRALSEEELLLRDALDGRTALRQTEDEERVASEEARGV